MHHSMHNIRRIRHYNKNRGRLANSSHQPLATAH
ncbi:hypothetical protein PssvBMR4_gp61 [Pseudomonas phage MR4]|uniref:Uncharacterized protein n=1 Tax=Pseudomonas phage MR4 TaxID=2711171 RepID=A0A6M3TCM0_9CAUD|nr:hypothetical protein PssvBMR4_gp61 [Pseudomonas phage MR4]